MNRMARDPDGRVEIFTETANRRGISPVIVEKDFWVCWTLAQVFENPEESPSFLFKGGTSLSKVFNAIQRFSEDIDLSINRHDLGFEDERDPARATTRNQQKKLLAELEEAKIRHIHAELVPQLKGRFGAALDESSDWSLEIDPKNSENVVFTYPVVPLEEDETAGSDIKREVLLEFGARSDHWPARFHEVEPYAAEEFPGEFRQPSVKVNTLEAERTFWEKITILHTMFHHSEPKTFRMSRHYYDVHMMTHGNIGPRALTNLKLLEDVVAHKNLFFRSAQANYERARPGTLRLEPNATLASDLKRDYDRMKEMFFDEPPTFDGITQTLAELEERINSLA